MRCCVLSPGVKYISYCGCVCARYLPFVSQLQIHPLYTPLWYWYWEPLVPAASLLGSASRRHSRSMRRWEEQRRDFPSIFLFPLRWFQNCIGSGLQTLPASFRSDLENRSQTGSPRVLSGWQIHFVWPMEYFFKMWISCQDVRKALISRISWQLETRRILGPHSHKVASIVWSICCLVCHSPH